MTGKPPFRPWGELEWALGLSAPRHWRFLGCVAAEDRSIAALIKLHHRDALADMQMLRIIDTNPKDAPAEEDMLQKHLSSCADEGIEIQPLDARLDAPLQNAAWAKTFSFSPNTSLCLDISCLPKRFFFPAIKAALRSENVKDFLLLYSQPDSYPPCVLSENPDKWTTLTGFGCDDPDREREAAKHLIVGAGFAVDGLLAHLEGRGKQMEVDVLIPFPAEPWASVRRSWDSAREIEEALGADGEQKSSTAHPRYPRVPAFDMSTAFDRLRSITQEGQKPAALAPLGPKPLSAAMCLLSSQKDHYPVYYAQPRTYALPYSTGCKVTWAYWIKHEGINLYSV